MGKILVTGAGGQLATALKPYYPDALYTSKDDLNLQDPKLTEKIKAIDPDKIINCAAIVGQVDAVEDNPLECIEVNAIAVYKMISAMREPSNFVQISSDYVKSDNIYGITKKLSEAIVLRRNGLVIRTSWVFGPSEESSNWPKWVLKNAHKMLTIVDDQIGRPTYAPDLAKAIKKLEGEHGLYEVQNSGEPVSWYDFAKAVCDIKGLECYFMPIHTEDYVATRPNVAHRPLNSLFQDFPDMPDWFKSLQEYIDEDC